MLIQKRVVAPTCMNAATGGRISDRMIFSISRSVSSVLEPGAQA